MRSLPQANDVPKQWYTHVADLDARDFAHTLLGGEAVLHLGTVHLGQHLSLAIQQRVLVAFEPVASVQHAQNVRQRGVLAPS